MRWGANAATAGRPFIALGRDQMSSEPLKDTRTSRGVKIGRPRKAPSADAEKRVEEAASKGASIIGIASYVGVSKTVLNRWLDEQPALKEAIDRGRERERNVLHSKLTEAAENGNIVAAIFLLKARHGYVEGAQGESANRVSITFNLPGALKPEQFTIENDTNTQPQRISTTSATRS